MGMLSSFKIKLFSIQVFCLIVFLSNARANLPIGLNLNSPKYYGNETIFKNLMFQAQQWTKAESWVGNKLDPKEIPVDTNGYPLELPYWKSGFDSSWVNTILKDNSNSNRVGKHVVLWEGEGTVIINEQGPLGETKTSTPGINKLEITFHPNQNAFLQIKRSKKGNNVRNVRVLSEADAATDYVNQPFNESYLKMVSMMRAVRFMPWQCTNDGQKVSNWAQRRKPTFYTQIGSLVDGGTAYEYLISLCNIAKVDGWFNIPHLADDNFIRQFALLVKNNLATDRRAYVELSNELWNWGGSYPQYHFYLDGPSGAAYCVNCPDSMKNAIGTDMERSRSYHVARVFRIWQSVFSGNDRSRLMCVAGFQIGYTDMNYRFLLQHLLTPYGAAPDAVSPAAYFGIPQAKMDSLAILPPSNWTVNNLVSLAKIYMAPGSDYEKKLREDGRLAKILGVKLLTYEGGSSIVYNQWEISASLKVMKDSIQALNSSPQMRDLYQRVCEIASDPAVDCKLWIAYSSSGDLYNYAHFENSDDFTKPQTEWPWKFRSLVDFNVSSPDRTPLPRAPITVPGKVPGYCRFDADSFGVASSKCIGWKTFQIPVKAEAQGTYDLVISHGSHGGVINCKMFVNNSTDSIPFTLPASSNSFTKSAPIRIALGKGYNMLEIKEVGGSQDFRIDTLHFTSIAVETQGNDKNRIGIKGPTIRKIGEFLSIENLSNGSQVSLMSLQGKVISSIKASSSGSLKISLQGNNVSVIRITSVNGEKEYCIVK